MKICKITAMFLAVVTAAAFLLTSCGKSSGLTIGEDEVPYDLLKYLAVNTRGDIEKKYGEDVWSSSNPEVALKELEDTVFDYITELYSIIALAEEYGLSADSDTVKEQLEAEKKLYIDSLGGDSEFKKELKEQSLSESAYDFITVNSILQEEAYYAIIEKKLGDGEKDELSKLFSAGEAVRIKQIVLPGTMDSARELADAAAARAEAGEDFELLISEYRALRLDNSTEYISEDAIVFRGVMHRELEDAAFSLDEGEVSGVLETDGGFVIIKVYPMDEEFISLHFDEMKERYQESLMYVALEEQKEKISIAKDEKYEKIDLSKIS